MMKTGMIVAAVAMLAAGGAIEVLRTGRRADAETIQRTAERLAALPLILGDWKGEDVPFDSKQLTRAGAQAHMSRLYKRDVSGEVISVLILAGNPRDMGAHDPTVCYAGLGYKQAGKEQRREVRPDPYGPPDSFWSAKFDSDDVSQSTLGIYWAWGTEGRWTASHSPRLDFSAEPLLLKIYVNRMMSRVPAPEEREPAEDFLRDLVPELRKLMIARAATERPN